MKPPEFVFRFLLLSSGTTYTAEVISGWRLSEECFDNPHSFELIHYNFDDDHEVLNILILLDKVREGFFQAVLVLPPASSWSRARHFGPGGQPPVRSRAQPWSITDTTGHSCWSWQRELDRERLSVSDTAPENFQWIRSNYHVLDSKCERRPLTALISSRAPRAHAACRSCHLDPEHGCKSRNFQQRWFLALTFRFVDHLAPISGGRPCHTLCRACELAGGRGYASRTPWKILKPRLEDRRTPFRGLAVKGIASAMIAEREALRMGIEHLTFLFPTEVSSFDVQGECTDRTVQYKLDAQSLRLFGLHSDVNDAHRASANRLQHKN